MEKHTNSAKFKFLRFLRKDLAIKFENIAYSPRRTSHSGKILPGPIIPSEARLRQNKSMAQEPTSPKISCMGQIKHKKKCVKKQEKVKKEKRSSVPKTFKLDKEEPIIRSRHVFIKQEGRKSDAGLSDQKAPSLSQMKRFASGRESMGSFDWTAKISQGGGDHDEEEVIIPFSAPMVMTGKIEPKKEINLWKRRPNATAKTSPYLVNDCRISSCMDNYAK